jgi:hypothetical protein
MEKKSWGKRFLGSASAAVMAVTSFMPGLSMRAGADDIGSDGLPNMKVPYEESIWYRGNPLGVAGDFHVVAFDSFTDNNHVNGNVATPHLIIGENGVGPSPNQYVGRLVNVVSDELETHNQKNEFIMNMLPDLVMPADYELYSSTGKKLKYPTDAANMIIYKGSKDSGAESFNFGVQNEIRKEPYNVDSYFAHFSDTFMDFDAIKQEYKTKSAEFAAKDTNVDFEFQHDSEYYHKLTINLNDSGENIYNLSIDDFIQPNAEINPKTGESIEFGEIEINNINAVKQEFNDYKGNPVSGFTYADDQYLILNINLEGHSAASFAPSKVTYNTKYGEKIKFGGEDTLYVGTNVIMNFYNGSKSGDTHLALNQNILASVIAPDTDLHLYASNGTFIGDTVTTERETHMAFFLEPMSDTSKTSVTAQKIWNDDKDHSADSVEIELYRAIKADINTEELPELAEQAKKEWESNKQAEESRFAVESAALINAYESKLDWNNIPPDTMFKFIDANDYEKGVAYPSPDHVLQRTKGSNDNPYISITNIEGSSGRMLSSNFDEGEYRFVSETYNYITNTSTQNDIFSFRVSDGAVIQIDDFSAVQPKHSVPHVELIDTQVLNEDNSWNYKWPELQRFNSDNFVTYYYIYEKKCSGWLLSIL